jgi:hypothetical protein
VRIPWNYKNRKISLIEEKLNAKNIAYKFPWSRPPSLKLRQTMPGGVNATKVFNFLNIIKLQLTENVVPRFVRRKTFGKQNKKGQI